MDLASENTLLCSCGRTFLQPGRLKVHQNSCKTGKKRLVNALEKAKETWTQRKRQRVQSVLHASHSVTSLPPHGFEVTPNIIPPTIQHGENSDTPQTTVLAEHMPMALENDHICLAERRPRRNIQLPARFRDVLPRALPLLPPVSEPLQPTPAPLSQPDHPQMPSSRTSWNQPLTSRALRTFRTPRNVFGLFRQYYSIELPLHDPEEHIGLQDLFDDQSVNFQDPVHRTDGLHNSSTAACHLPLQLQENHNPFYPFPNENSFRLGNWYWNHGVQKSRESFHELLGVVGSSSFSPDDVRDTRWDKINKILGRNDFDGEEGAAEEDGEWMDEDAGWTKTPIRISVPFHKRTKKPGPQDFLAGYLYHRNLVSVIREKIANPHDDEQFHYEPFELFWQATKTSPDVRVYGELYTSPAFVEAHRELQEAPGEPGCNLPKVVVAMMFWSDGTKLTQFGNAQLWPSYLYFGNESKYRRCKPTCHLCNHVAYFETLPDAFTDFASENMNTRPSNELLTHCRREMLHAQWEILLDDEFVEAYEHGIVIKCCDAITRRFYPRIVTYSADYKEKIILATIRNRGYCPCPRCLIPLSRFEHLGKKRDMKQRESLARVDDETWRRKVGRARDIIYKKNYAVDTEAVESILKEESWVPTQNAFSRKLAKFGFNLFQMLPVDLMHEFELGVWKALLIHLLRILNAADKTLINELDRRFRQVPTFGADTIRRFSANVSELKKLAARDFEDILQCSIPVFEGLLPEPYNSAILRLLFICAHWHGLAKLRLHTDDTLGILDETTMRIGDEFRAFAGKTCPTFDTRELDREVAARRRKRLPKAQGQLQVQGHSSAPTGAATDEPRKKKFNLRTYKYHSLGDYANTIRRYGTTDSYSTEPGELEHRTPKARYKRTDKKLFVKQLAAIERREVRLRRIRARLYRDGDTCEKVARTPEEHHHIGTSQNQFEHIGSFLNRNSGDPATKNFLPKLKQYLFRRILDDAEVLHAQTEHSPDRVLFKHDRMYSHNLLRINYTTYDVRRSQDTVNPSTSHCNVMVLANQDGRDTNQLHPFRYARVLGVYHVNVVYTGPGMLDYQPHRMEFLWVRWYQVLGTASAGWRACKLDCIRFPPVTDEDAFGIIDPSYVLRSCHVIPSFARGKVHLDGRGLSLYARDSLDWAAYYVNRFVDRDMLMRYHFGLGVGHVYPHRSTADEELERLPRNGSQEHDMGESDDDLLEAGEQSAALGEIVEPHQEESTSDDSADWDDGEDSQEDPITDEETDAMELYGS